MESEKLTVLEILGVIHHEDQISNLIKHFLEKDRNFRKAFLEKIGMSDSDIEVHLRELIKHSNRQIHPDIIIVDKDKKDMAIIENKVTAEEGKDQTEIYFECKQQIMDKYGVKKEPKFIFLTLYKRQKPVEESFKPITYEELIKDVFPKHKIKETIGKILDELCYKLKEFYENKPKDTDKIFSKMGLGDVKDKLDKNYNYYASLIEESLPKGMIIESMWRHQMRGPPIYGACITQKNWNSTKSKKEGDKRQIDKLNHRIHIEPIYERIKNTIKFEVHYETYPYVQIKNQLQTFNKLELEKWYKKPRKNFIEALTKELESENGEWKIYDKKQKDCIAKSKSPLRKNITFSEFKEKLKQQINEIAPKIDKAMSIMKNES